jgi:syntaxin 5
MLSSTAPPASHASYTRDRTKEFHSLIALAKQRRPSPDAAGPAGNGTQPSTSGLGQPASAVQQQSEFSKRASAIGIGIHSTSQKLQKLTQLAKRTSMFDDPTQEIHDLSSIVKHDIQALNQGITDLQTFLGGVGNKQSARHSSTVVETLRNRLKDATKEFKNVLELRTDNLKVHEERKSLFDSSSGSSSSLQRMGMPPGLQPGASFLPRRGGVGGGMGGGMGGIDVNGAGVGVGASGQGIFQNQQQDQALLQQNTQDAYLTSRQDALQGVESTILELGNIFQQLSHMVHEQGEMAVRIDENMDETFTQVEAGQAQLLKYLNTMSGNRWLMLKVFGLVAAMLVFFLMFIA